MMDVQLRPLQQQEVYHIEQNSLPLLILVCNVIVAAAAP